MGGLLERGKVLAQRSGFPCGKALGVASTLFFLRLSLSLPSLLSLHVTYIEREATINPESTGLINAYSILDRVYYALRKNFLDLRKEVQRERERRHYNTYPHTSLLP